MFDISTGVDVLELVPAQVLGATASGSGADVSGLVGTANVIMSASVTGGTNPTLDVKLQTSVDDVDAHYADTDPAVAFDQITVTGNNCVSKALDLRSVKQYVRAVATIGGTATPEFNIAVVLTAAKQYQP